MEGATIVPFILRIMQVLVPRWLDFIHSERNLAQIELWNLIADHLQLLLSYSYPLWYQVEYLLLRYMTNLVIQFKSTLPRTKNITDFFTARNIKFNTWNFVLCKLKNFQSTLQIPKATIHNIIFIAVIVWTVNYTEQSQLSTRCSILSCRWQHLVFYNISIQESKIKFITRLVE